MRTRLVWGKLKSVSDLILFGGGNIYFYTHNEIFGGQHTSLIMISYIYILYTHMQID